MDTYFYIRASCFCVQLVFSDRFYTMPLFSTHWMCCIIFEKICCSNTFSILFCFQQRIELIMKLDFFSLWSVTCISNVPSKQLGCSCRHSASLLLSFLPSRTHEVSVLSSLFSCSVCGNSYCYYFHVCFSVRCWFCILVSEQILHVGLKWLSCDDRRGQKAMGVWMSRFHSRHFSEGNALGRVATLSLALWSQPSFSTIPISSLVPLFLTHAEFEATERVQWDATWASGQCHRVLPWGRLRCNGRDFSGLPMHAFCILYFCAWLQKWAERTLEGSPVKASCGIYICVIHQPQPTRVALRRQYTALRWCK